MWTAFVTVSLDYPRPARPGILHLMVGAVRREGAQDVTTPEAFVAFLESHRDIGTVIVYDSRFPQRAMPFRKFIEKHSRKIWKDAELLAAIKGAEAKRVADPNYVPTVAEATRNAKEFVEAMTEDRRAGR